MAKITWTFKNEEGTNLNRYIATNVSTGEKITFDLLRGGNISVVGTPLNAENLNALITSINACYDLITSSEKDTTYTLSKNGNAIRLTSSSGAINDVTLNKSDVGLSNVDNTSDMNKPISNATQKALDLKADKKDVSEVDIDLEGTGTIVSIPENATGYGAIDKLGGKSYKSENLLVLNDIVETTTNGITYSIKNGVITLNGTATANINLWLNLANTIQIQSVYVYVDIENSGTDNVDKGWVWLAETNPNYSNRFQAYNGAKTLTYSLSAIDIYIGSSKSINAKIYPMLVKGSNAPSEFSQGFEGIKIEYPTNVKVLGANVLNIPNIAETTTNGITYSVTNGELKMKGKTTGNYWKVYIPLNSDLEIGQYLFTSYGSGVSSGTTLYFENVNSGNEYVDFASPLSTNKQVNFSKTVKYIRIYIHTSGTSIDFTSKLLLTKNATAPTTFRPYIEPQLLPQTSIINYVSNQLQTNHSWTSQNASKWLGLGVSDSNIIDYANKKAIVKYNIVDLGTLNWQSGSNFANCFYATIDDKLASSLVLLNDKYTNLETRMYASSLQNDTSKDKCIVCDYSTTSKIVIIKDTVYNNATTFKTAMQGVMLIYELATPIEIDLSSLETETHFECEPNGSIIHDTIANYKYSFPVSLKGQVELNFEHDKEQQRDIDSLKKEIDELDNNKVPITRTVNGKSLNEDITLNSSDVGLGNVNNTSDLDKPISNATQNALNNKLNSTTNEGFNVESLLKLLGDNVTTNIRTPVSATTDNTFYIASGSITILQKSTNKTISNLTIFNGTGTDSSSADYDSNTGIITFTLQGKTANTTIYATISYDITINQYLENQIE